MTDTPQVLLAHHLKALKLPTFLREYDKLARQCAVEGVDHPRYLLRLGVWLRGLLARSHRNVVIVALAGKLARIAWAVLSGERSYQAQAAA